ncbi:hypothetical protein STEG23_026059 [Scotinomys teguina]
MKFAGKWKELENIILSEVTQTQKDKHGSLKRKALLPVVAHGNSEGKPLAFGLLAFTSADKCAYPGSVIVGEEKEDEEEQGEKEEGEAILC